MSVEVKICGINSVESAQAAKIASFVGFVFYPKSPRYINGKEAQKLSRYLPKNVKKVGLFVEEEDEKISEILSSIKLDYLQFHGDESPNRIDEVRKKFKLPIIKAIKIKKEEDLENAYPYYKYADMLLFDTKPPEGSKDLMPGGNAISFDWKILSKKNFPISWMLSGGLNAQNITKAIAVSGAKIIDVSSGVEESRGNKSAKLIKEFLEISKKIN
jgi:phosphoribosylanthranilate isomerase